MNDGIYELLEMCDQDERLAEEGFGTVLEDEGTVYHRVGVYDGGQAWMEYEMDVKSVLESQRNDVQLFMGEMEEDTE